ncbi:MAG: hypothetical protein RR582_06145 [Niameybacter sp.]
MKNKNAKGYTLLEVIGVTLITTMIIGSLTGFLVTMIKSYNLTETHVDLQYQAQSVLNNIVEEIKYAKGIGRVYAKGSSSSVETSTQKQTIEVIELKTLEEKYIYFKVHGNKLYYVESEDMLEISNLWEEHQEDLLATGIKQIEVTPLKDSFAKTDSVQIVITLERGDVNLAVSNQVTMRNKE